MHDMNKFIDKIHCMKEKIINDTESLVNCGVFSENVNGDGVGKAIDMIKDLSEAEEKMYKAMYYSMILSSDEENNRYGYDDWRYPSSGRYAPKGSGRFYGYAQMDELDQMYPKMHSDNIQTSERYGYPMDNQHSMTYNNWHEAKKHFTESKDPNSRNEVQSHAGKHLDETIQTTKEIWADAKPEARMRFKEQMGKILNEM